MSKENVKNQKSAKSEVKITALQVIPVLPLVPVPSLEEKNKQLEKEIAKLKAKIEETPQTLEEKIEFFKLKQDRMKKLAQLDNPLQIGSSSNLVQLHCFISIFNHAVTIYILVH